MVFNSSGEGGCRANTDDATDNPTAITTDTLARAAHINELRKAIEEWCTTQAATVPVWTNPKSSTPASNPTSKTIRAAHINELRKAINQIRRNIARATCNSHNECGGHNCGCHSGMGFGCGCDCNSGCTSQTFYRDTMTSYSWSNNGGGCNSNTGSESDPKRIGEIPPALVNDALVFEELKSTIASINDDNIVEGYYVSNWNQAFPS